MILRALYDYYDRLGNLPPFGFEKKELAFTLRINAAGKLLAIEDNRVDKKRCKSFLVVKTIGRSSGAVTNTLWDNTEYVLGYSEKATDEKGIEKVKIKNSLFISRVEELCARFPENEEFKAVVNFYNYEQTPIEQIKELDEHALENMAKSNANLSFRFDGNYDRLVCEHTDLEQYVGSDGTESQQKTQPICLVTGQRCTPVLTSTSTMIPGSQATAKIVAFQINSGYDSYGKSQGTNAPISPSAEFAYSTALLHLLAKDSENKFLLGSRTYLFWTSSKSNAAKEMEKSLFAFLNNKQDDPNENIDNVRTTFRAIYSGTLRCDLDERFYVLGLAPNAARIAVVYWQELPLKEFAKNILEHFEDMEIVDTRKEQTPYEGLFKMLSCVALNGRMDKMPPNLGDALTQSIFNGTLYPAPLYQACIRRIRATGELSIARAALLKAYLNRKYHSNKITVMLNEKETNAAYLCGRLFAVMEKAQTDGNRNLSSTIRDRYLDAAASSPSSVFPTLFKLFAHHLEKLSPSSKVYYDRLFGSILDNMGSNGFPIHLSLEDQGRFFIGYYHQRQELFRSKKDKENEEN